jgi:hypothetical protein
MTRSYQFVPPPGSPPTLDPQQLAELLAKDRQLLLPLLDLLENAQCALDALIDVMGVTPRNGKNCPPSPDAVSEPAP